MNILLLGHKDTIITDFLSKSHTVFVEDAKITTDDLMGIDYVISYGYNHIFSREVINYMDGKIINLTLSYLPYNRGSDPNFWSWIGGTQKGVSIHRVAEGINTGDILLQKQVTLSSESTLRKTDKYLRSEIEVLFINNWDAMIRNELTPILQSHGTYHCSTDKDFFVDDIPGYLDMRIDDLISHCELRRVSSMENLANFYDPLFWLLDLVCTRENINPIELMSPRTNTQFTMVLYLVLTLSNDFFNKRTGKSRRLYSLHHISNFFSKSHSLVAIATRRVEGWTEIYRAFRIKKQLYEIKLNEKYGLL